MDVSSIVETVDSFKIVKSFKVMMADWQVGWCSRLLVLQVKQVINSFQKHIVCCKCKCTEREALFPRYLSGSIII